MREKGVRLAQIPKKMQVGACMPVGVQLISYGRLRLAQLLGQLGVLLTLAQIARSMQITHSPPPASKDGVSSSSSA